MKKFLALLLLVGTWNWELAPAHAALISQYPNTTSLQSGDLFVIERPGVTNFNFDFGDLFTALNLGSASLQPASAFDAAGVALNATNGIGPVTGMAAFINTNTLQNFASNSAFGSSLTQINTTSNMLEQQIISGGVTAAVATNIAQSIADTSSNLVWGNALGQINTSSNSLVGTEQTAINSSSNSLYGTVNTAKADKSTTLTVNGTANQITSSAGAQDLSANRTWTLSLPSSIVLPGTITGDASLLTNILNGATVSAGANITVTATKNPVTGSTNYQMAVADPANFSQVNAGTMWITNSVSPTNAFGGTTIDFSKAYNGTTNLGGNLTFTAVSGVTLGAENATILHLIASGADRTIAFPANWHTNLSFIGVVTNGWEMDLLFTVQPSVRTNVAQILYP